MRVTVVANPVAGGQHFDRQSVETLVARVAACAGVSAHLYVTRGPDDGRLRTRAAVESGADVVVAWGGDGTVSEVASVLAGTSVAMGIVPKGSGNGLARELQLPAKPADALRIAFGRKVRSIDVPMLGDRAFVNVAGFGFDAQVARRFNANGGARGFTRYIAFTVTEIFRYLPQHYTIRWDGGAYEGMALIVVFANSRQYGNGARVAPLAALDDGALDCVIVRPTHAARDLWRSRRLFTGTILDDPSVEFARVREATIASDQPLCGHVDGEPVTSVGSLDLHVRPRALQVCAR